MSDEVSEVLIVDDDIDYSVLLGLFLTRSSDMKYQPTLCHSGEEAIMLCNRERFDCILMDYRLCDGTGVEVITRLKESQGIKLPPIIVITSSLLENEAAEALLMLATEFIIKDNINQNTLEKVVAKAITHGKLRRGAQEQNTQLMVANLELERRTNEIQRFYYAVSHEMKTPLTATREFISIVLDGLMGPINEGQAEVLNNALICCDQITDQFHDLIDLTRMETGQLALKMEPATLIPLLSRAIDISTKGANEKKINLELIAAKDLPFVLMDEGRISQVVNNLLNNAIKFTDPGGRIRLSVKKVKHGHVQIRVTDTGQGVPKAYLTDIFDRLFQVERLVSNKAETGLGLGLSVAQEIVNGHGSKLMVRSSLGHGSSFYFVLKETIQPVISEIDDMSINEIANVRN